MIIDNYMCTTASMTAISNLPIEPESLLVQRMHPNVFYKRTKMHIYNCCTLRSGKIRMKH